VVRDFELNELHLQCKKTLLSRRRDRKDVSAAESTAEVGDDLSSDVKKTQ